MKTGTKERQQQNRIDLSLLRVLATLGVVFLHTCSVLTGNEELFAMEEAQKAFFVCGRELCAAMLPLFFMFTGALMLRKEKELTIKNCLCKYVKRLVLALFLFGVPFAMMIRFAETRTFSPGLIWQGFADVISGNSFAHLWYLYMLIGIYLILPMIKLYTDYTSHEQQRYLLIVLFICNLIFPTIEAATGFHIDFEVPIASIGVFFVLLGKYLDDAKRSYAKGIPAVTAVLLSAVIIWIVKDAEPVWGGFLGYLSPIIAGLSVSIFLLLKGVKLTSEKRRATLWKLDRLCFGVYLIHPVIIQFTYRVFGLTPMCFKDAWVAGTILLFLAFAAVSFVGAWVMSLIPSLKKYVL